VNDLEDDVRRIGHELAAAFPSAVRRPARALNDQAMALASGDEELKAALFRFVDVVPACRGVDDLARHLIDELGQVSEPPLPVKAAMRVRGPASRRALGAASAMGVKQMAHRFIVGETPDAALPVLRKLWRSGQRVSVDLLGEATVTHAEADRYAARCLDALRALAGANPEDANLSVKVSALTPLLRPEAPERGREDAARRLRPLLREARALGAHLHVDMESLDTREATLGLVTELLSEPEFADGPPAGMVLQGYLKDSPQELDEVLAWARSTPRAHPLVVRLVKGAYWDHEVIDARQHGWAPPVFDTKPECDANFEALTVRLLEARPHVRVAVASHNLRSVAHALAQDERLGGGELELQVLRGLGDDLGEALAATGRRVRVYCPVGDLVAGMAYLVRRLLENTSNESFLAEQASGASLDRLLAAP